MNIPLVDLKAQYATIKDEIDGAIASVIAKTAFVGGPFAKKFEEEFSAYIGAKHCIGVGNGTDALVMALRWLELKPGDEIIVPALTFIATSEAVTLAGGKVVFADVDPITRTIDPAAVEAAITERTRAVIPVHLYGRPADMDALCALGKKHGLALIEDGAQAQGARIDNQRVGSCSTLGCFSFYPGKNLGAYGDAGAVVLNDDQMEEKIRMLANHGRMAKYGHIYEGTNSRLDGLQGAILSVKLKHLDDWNAARRKAADGYRERLAGLDLVLPADHPGHVYHLFVIETEKREELLAHLKENGVGASIHYPDALPRLKAYDYLGHKEGAFPVAEKLAATILSLPIYAEITAEQTDFVADQVKAFFKKG